MKRTIVILLLFFEAKIFADDINPVVKTEI